MGGGCPLSRVGGRCLIIVGNSKLSAYLAVEKYRQLEVGGGGGQGVDSHSSLMRADMIHF